MLLTIGIFGIAYLTVLALLTLLSLRSVIVLRAAAPWTSAGWLATIGYDLAASYEICAHAHLPLHAPYWFLGALTAAFVIAGVRDEPQAEPWWLPRRIGLSRARRRSIGTKPAA